MGRGERQSCYEGRDQGSQTRAERSRVGCRPALQSPSRLRGKQRCEEGGMWQRTGADRTRLVNPRGGPCNFQQQIQKTIIKYKNLNVLQDSGIGIRQPSPEDAHIATSIQGLNTKETGLRNRSKHLRVKPEHPKPC